jgi:hypothetical protein
VAPVLAVNAPVASANTTPHCITHAEFRAIKKGYSQTHVSNIVGAVGSKEWQSDSPGYHYKEISYRPCWPYNLYSDVTVDYFKSSAAGVWRVDDKYAFWMHN